MSVLSLLPEDKRKDPRKESLESVYSSNSRLNLLNKRKRMNALTGDMSSYHNLSGKGDRYVTQRVLSAKTHRVKQLQNQLADAHYHLQEISNENRVLRALQKKQEIALQRYENSNAELPQVLNSHSEEMRIQQTKYKQLKMQFKELSQKAKEKDIQLQTLKDEHQHLVELSKDRNLPEREKLQAQVAELTQKVQMQAETINMLQRRISLEAKNFKHQLQVEINKHKDTRHDLDLAITNADKLSTIIEMKEKMLSTAASRSLRSPNKSSSVANINRVVKSAKYLEGGGDRNLDRNIDNSALGRLCQDSRQISSSFSHDEDLTTSMTAEPSSRSRYSRSNSRAQSTSSRTTPNQTRKSSKGSDEMLELSRTVQEGMAELNLYDEDSEMFLKNNTSEDVQKKVEAMKADLVNKIINNEDPLSSQSFRMRKMSTDSKEDLKLNEEPERPKSRGRRNSSVSFFGNEASEEIKTLTFIESNTEVKTITPKRESSNLEAKLSGKPIDKYCKDIIHDIERSSKVIERHVKSFASSRFDNDKIVQQLQAVDKLNHYVNAQGEVPDEALNELNNNFKMLTDQVLPESSSARKRSVSGRRSSRMESRTNLLGDNCISNQDLLEDLLGKK